MKTAYKLLWAVTSLVLAQMSSADTILRQKTYDLTSAGNPTVFTLKNTTYLGAATDNDGLPQAKLSFNSYKASFGRCMTTSEDWSPYNILCIKLSNRVSSPLDFKMLVYLTADPSNSTNVFSATLHLNANETKRFLCQLNPIDGSQYDLEYMRPVLSAPYANVYSGATGQRDLRTIYNWRISYQGSAPAEVDVSDLRLIQQNPIFDGMVDAFGQYTDRDWTGKIKSLSDFAARKADELTDLSANPGTGEQLGTTKVINPTPTLGVWKVVRSASGMKYLQHPNGRMFWSLGVSAVGTGVWTPVQLRQNYFQSLPSATSIYGPAYAQKPTPDGTQTCYAFTTQNLIAKYGSNYTPSWVPMVKNRLASWGINTLGIQCASNFTDNSIPYTVLMNTCEFTNRLVVPYTTWGSMPDAFDSTFSSWMKTNFASTLTANAGKTNFMGVYVDNEMAWGNVRSDARRCNLAMGALKAPSAQPAKLALVNQLTAKYFTISALNRAWGTSFSSFNSILNSQYQPGTINASQLADFEAFSTNFAKTYFSKVQSALKADGLKSLYLGCRFADYTPEAVLGAEPYVDVHTFNAYRTCDNVDWNFMNSLTKPVLFSEMGYSVQGNGTFGGPAEVSSETERDTNVSNFLNRAAQQPNVVGVILYCYYDQPITGRYSDYENAGLGMVDVGDTPHYGVINTLRQFAKTMYTNRA